jgi:TRAP-type C4-dicarboxylate transport system permease small subunit
LFELFDRTLEKVTMALAYGACVIVTTIFTMIVIDVSIRSLGFTPPSFTLAVVEYGLLYFAMFSAPYLVRHRGHVAIEALVSTLPDAIRTALAKIVYVVCIAVSLLFAYYSLILEIEALESGQVDVRGIDMPYWILFLPMALCFVLVALEFLRYLIGPYSYYSYDLSEVRDDV